MSETWLVADPHFGHANIITYCDRPFGGVAHMNSELIRRWNEIVGKEDDIWCLGDFSLSIRVMEEITPQLNGIKYLVPGNHDQCHSVHGKKAARAKERYEDAGWIVMDEYVEGFTPEIDLCHLPYKGHQNERFHKLHPDDNGKWLLHGHVHTQWKVKGKMLNVGVDQWQYAPVHISQILKITELQE